MMLVRGTNEEASVRSHFEAMVLGRMSLTTFGDWLYSHADLTPTIGYADHDDLLSFDYTRTTSAPQLRAILRPIYGRWWPGPEATQIIWYSELLDSATAILDHTLSVTVGARAIVNLMEERVATLLPSHLVQPIAEYTSEYDVLSELYYDSEDMFLAEVRRLQEQWHDRIERACRDILIWCRA